MKIHFIAIGGSAMHNLALALQAKGHEVSGSDDVFYEPSRSRLAERGLLPRETGWFPDQITEDLDFVILGMHAREDNPELSRARRLNLKIYSYPEYLYEHSKNKTRVVIAGSHGKTTITGMVLHAMKYQQRKVDFMVGAQLEDFDTMVHLSDSNDFVVIEGDEYLTSPIDRRPKIHLYRPNIALISGIAWDHINAFPTFENYVEQFRIFIDTITEGGVLVYNEEDEAVRELVESSTRAIRKLPYRTPAYEVKGGQTFLKTHFGELPLKIFGAHNMLNLEGAKWICQNMGMNEEDFYEAMPSFKGAAKRLEKMAERENDIIYRDFAHAPSKVRATVKALKEQYPDRKLWACLELHTYSSLDESFIKEYKGALDGADAAIVFYDPEALKIKQKQPLSEQALKMLFGREVLLVFTTVEDLKRYIKTPFEPPRILLFMSSGGFGGLLDGKFSDE